MMRSAAAVAGGFILIAVLSFGADAVMRAVVPGVFGPDGSVQSTAALWFVQMYVAIFAITGCYLAARWAGRRPMAHAMVLGALGLAFNVISATVMWDTLPTWYWIVALALVLPYAWIGGRLREMEEARSGAVGIAGAAVESQSAASSSRAK